MSHSRIGITNQDHRSRASIRWVIRIGLLIVGCLLALTTAVRIGLAFETAPSRTVWIVIIAGSMAYLTFALEGLSISAGKLRDIDSETLRRHAHLRYPRHSAKICDIGESMNGSGYERFLTGQQVLTIVLVLLMNTSLEWLVSAQTCPSADGSPCMPGAHAWLSSRLGRFGSTALWWVNSDYATYLIATLLVCWLFQLAPGLIAKDREVAFLRIPLTGLIVYFGRVAARMQLGYPGELLATISRKFSGFRTIDDLGLSPREVYDDLVRTIGVSVEDYRVTITMFSNKTEVTEEITYAFHGGEVLRFQHRVTPPKPLDREFLFEIGPEEIVDGPRSKRIIEHVRRVDPRAGSLPTVEIICFDVHFLEALPRSVERPDFVNVMVFYEIDALDTDPSHRDTLDFTVQKPLRAMKIDIIDCREVRLKNPPGVNVKFPGEMTNPRNELRQTPTPNRTGDTTTIDLEYLLHATRVEITLDAE